MALPLPYRPLDVRGQGVYDQAFDRYFPFKTVMRYTSGNILEGKRGYYLYIHRFIISAANYGDRAAGYVEVGAGGVVLGRVLVGETTAAAGTTSTAVLAFQPDYIVPPNTAVTLNSGAASGFALILYAEIPADGDST